MPLGTQTVQFQRSDMWYGLKPSSSYMQRKEARYYRQPTVYVRTGSVRTWSSQSLAVLNRRMYLGVRPNVNPRNLLPT